MKYMCMSACQACPASWKVIIETPLIRATAKIRRVESPLPAMRHDSVATSAIATMIVAGISQSAPRAMPMAMAIGTCSQSTASNALLVVSRKTLRSSVSTVIPIPLVRTKISAVLFPEAGGNRLRIHGQPDTGLAQPRQSVAVIGPHHQK